MEFFIIMLMLWILVFLYSIDNKLSKLPKPQRAKVILHNFREHSAIKDGIFNGDIVIILHYLPDDKVVVRREGSKKIETIWFYGLELIND